MYKIEEATKEDLQEILDLQHLAFLTEAEVVGSMEIPPLKQDIDGLQEDFVKCKIYVAIDESRKIVGSVRTTEIGETIDIGKLMVHPDNRRQGIAKQLLNFVEKENPDKRLELFTCTLSVSNIRLYESVGFKQYEIKSMPSGLDFVFLEKNV